MNGKEKTMRISRTMLIGLWVLGATWIGGARAASAVTIADIVASPDDFEGQTVTVTGTVEASIPVGTESGYNLRGGPGAAKVTVVSRTGAPAPGANITITAKVQKVQAGDGPEDRPFPPWLLETSRTVN